MPGQKRVFLVEDHPATAHAVKGYLEAIGYSVSVAHDVRSALQTGSVINFDVLVCDLYLPDGTGWDVMRKLRARRPVKGIAFSAFDGPEDRLRSKEVGFAEHVVKSAGPDRLLQAITRQT